jgi:hypothetical protein
MAQLIASELRASDESGDEAAVPISKPPARRTKKQKKQAPPATLGTRNSFDVLPVEESSDADDEDYEDDLPPLQSPSDSESEDDMEMTNEEV